MFVFTQAPKRKEAKKGKPKTNGLKPGKTDRDENGLFQPGCAPGPGRPKGIDYRKAVEDYAAEHEIDIRKAIGEVTVALIASAKSGDTQAAKLLFDRNCGPLKQGLDLTDNREPPEMTDLERATRVRQILEEHGMKVVEVEPSKEEGGLDRD